MNGLSSGGRQCGAQGGRLKCDNNLSTTGVHPFETDDHALDRTLWPEPIGLVAVCPFRAAVELDFGKWDRAARLLLN